MVQRHFIQLYQRTLHIIYIAKLGGIFDFTTQFSWQCWPNTTQFFAWVAKLGGIGYCFTMAKKLKKLRKLTVNQQKFVDLYTGNLTETARLAGYSNPNNAGSKLWAKENVRYAIQNRNKKEVAIVEVEKVIEGKTVIQEKIVTTGDIAGIADREARQKFFSDVMMGTLKDSYKNSKGEIVETPCKMSDRIKCAELLGRSEGDFVDRINLEIGLQEELDNMSADQVDSEIKELIDMGILDLIMDESSGRFEVKHDN